MKQITIITAFLALILLSAAPAMAVEYTDTHAGFAIEYDDAVWTMEDMGFMFGDMQAFDDKLVSTPLVLTDYDLEWASVFVAVSERDDYEYSIVDFIKDNMGDMTINDIYEVDDTFTDSSGDEFDSLIIVKGMLPEFEDEGILLRQVFFANGKRYELCFLGLPESFVDGYADATAIMDSIDIL